MEAAAVKKKVLARECKLCGQQLPAAEWKNHIWSVEHVENEKLLKRDILIAGFPSDTKKGIICDVFAKFGVIEHSLKDGQQLNKCMAIHFDNENSATEVLLRKHQLGRHELNVVARHPNLLQTALHSKELAWTEFMLNFLLSKRSLSQQLAYIANELRLSEDEQLQREVFCERLGEKFQEFVPTCRLKPFGPSVNGLGIKGGDLDLFLNLNVPPVQMKITVDMEKIRQNLDLVRMAPDKSGFVTLIGSLAMVEVVEVFSSILQKYVPGCQDVVAQASARCPTIRFYLQGLQINCEIAVNNVLALQNSSLICFYNRLDERFQSLYYALYFWMTYHHLENSKKGRLSKYALAMLTIFYLQSCSPRILPTIEELQNLEKDADVELLLNDWECRFCTDVEKVKREENKRSIGYLFANFFNFYEEYNLEDKVLCVRTGKMMSKERFKAAIDQHKDSNKLAKFKMGHLTVQDPFELSRNVTANLTEDVFKEFVNALKDTARRSSSNKYWTKADPGYIWGFSFLLCGELGRYLPAESSELQSDAEILEPFTVTISFKPGECCDYVVTSQNFASNHATSCSRRICRIIREILVRGYEFTLQDLPEDDNFSNYEDSTEWLHWPVRRRGRMRGKWQRLAGNNHSRGNIRKPLDEYLIETYFPVWWDRNEIRMQLGDTPMDIVGAEGAITNIVKTLYRKFSTDVPVCECLCTLTPLWPPSEIGVLLKVEPLHLPGRNDWRKSFHEFFKNDIPNLVRRVISDQISSVAVVEVF